MLKNTIFFMNRYPKRKKIISACGSIQKIKILWLMFKIKAINFCRETNVSTDSCSNGCSVSTVRWKTDLVKTSKLDEFPSVANVVMDTTCFGRGSGVMVFMDGLTGQTLYK